MQCSLYLLAHGVRTLPPAEPKLDLLTHSLTYCHQQTSRSTRKRGAISPLSQARRTTTSSQELSSLT